MPINRQMDKDVVCIYTYIYIHTHKMEILLNGHRVSVWDDERFLDMDSGDACTALWMDEMSLNCALKND